MDKNENRKGTVEIDDDELKIKNMKRMKRYYMVM